MSYMTPGEYEILCNDTVCGEITDGKYREIRGGTAPFYLVRGGSFAAWVEHRALSESREQVLRRAEAFETLRQRED